MNAGASSSSSLIFLLMYAAACTMPWMSQRYTPDIQRSDKIHVR